MLSGPGPGSGASPGPALSSSALVNSEMFWSVVWQQLPPGERQRPLLAELVRRSGNPALQKILNNCDGHPEPSREMQKVFAFLRSYALEFALVSLLFTGVVAPRPVAGFGEPWDAVHSDENKARINYVASELMAREWVRERGFYDPEDPEGTRLPVSLQRYVWCLAVILAVEGSAERESRAGALMLIEQAVSEELSRRAVEQMLQRNRLKLLEQRGRSEATLGALFLCRALGVYHLVPKRVCSLTAPQLEDILKREERVTQLDLARLLARTLPLLPSTTTMPLRLPRPHPSLSTTQSLLFLLLSYEGSDLWVQFWREQRWPSLRADRLLLARSRATGIKPPGIPMGDALRILSLSLQLDPPSS